MIGRYLGAPHAATAPEFIPSTLWPIVSREILRQCDGLDGVEDGYITEPDDCDFDPEALTCVGDAIDGCLSQAQVEALKKIYSPLLGSNGQLIFPRYDPGSESGQFAQMIIGGELLLNVSTFFSSGDFIPSS
jgi:hypothetical protein